MKPLFIEFKILNSFKNDLENCAFISKYLKVLLPSVCNSWFKFSFESYSYDDMGCINLGYLKLPFYSKAYSTYSINVNGIYV